jgi:peptide deformylase
MSHLKKLSDMLSKNIIPSVKPIGTVKNIDSNMLEIRPVRKTQVTKKMKEYMIPSLIKTASHYALGSLSANQINLDIPVFVIHKDLEKDKWYGYKGSTDYYNVYINPKILSASDPIVQGKEKCPSLPHLVAEIERHRGIETEYMDINSNYIDEEFSDFYARVFMHEFDHLEGILMNNFTVNLGKIEVESSSMPELDRVVQEYKSKLDYSIGLLEDKYLIDKKYKKFVDKKPNKKEFFISEIVDEEFEADFNIALMAAYDNV